MLTQTSRMESTRLYRARNLDSDQQLYTMAVEWYFGTGTAAAFWKGRVALYAILKALDIGRGDEVIVPGYTCVMVPGSIIYTGATPIYADIDPDSYGVRAEEVERKITRKTKAILVQHTYGIPADIQKIRQIADGAGIPVIEDCCHTFGGRLGGQLLGTFGTAAFFSSQWNKPFSTGLGGIALVHDKRLASRVAQEQARYAVPSRRDVLMLKMQHVAHQALVFPSTTATLTRLFRWLTRKGWVVGSSHKEEFGIRIPGGYARRASGMQCRVGLKAMLEIETNNEHRCMLARRYLEELPELGYVVPKLPSGAEAPILRFPLRVANKKEVLEHSLKCGVEIGSWFECPLHPQETDQDAFGYRRRSCPEAEKAAREVVNLPTHRRVSNRDIEKTITFVRKVCQPAPAATRPEPAVRPALAVPAQQKS